MKKTILIILIAGVLTSCNCYAETTPDKKTEQAVEAAVAQMKANSNYAIKYLKENEDVIVKGLVNGYFNLVNAVEEVEKSKQK